MITGVTFYSSDPPMFMFASAGKKITWELVEKNKMFSANFVSTESNTIGASLIRYQIYTYFLISDEAGTFTDTDRNMYLSIISANLYNGIR